MGMSASVRSGVCRKCFHIQWVHQVSTDDSDKTHYSDCAKCKRRGSEKLWRFIGEFHGTELFFQDSNGEYRHAAGLLPERPVPKLWHRIVAIAILVGVPLVPLGIWLYLSNQPSPPPPPKVETRIDKLKKIVADQEQESAKVFSDYRPTTRAQIDDLTASAEDIIRQLPGVAHVDVAVRAAKPTHRIIHLRDWHTVPADLYAVDLKNATGKDLSADEIAQRHKELLLEVEAVQAEQIALIRCLIIHHGLKRLYSEGLTEKDLPNFTAKVAALRDIDNNEIARARKELDGVRQLLKTLDCKSNPYRCDEAMQIEATLLELIGRHQRDLVEFGVPARLLIAGEVREVLPLDDAALLDQAKPITPEGKTKFDPDKMKARHDAQVKAVMDKGGCGLVVLGGAHDLGESVRRLGQGRCEYIRVTTRRFKEFSE